MENKEFVLKSHLDQVKNDYDFIIIDCPPSLSLLTLNALVAADTVLVPIQCEYYALEGLSQVLRTINIVKRKMNPSLEMLSLIHIYMPAVRRLSLQRDWDLRQLCLL